MKNLIAPRLAVLLCGLTFGLAATLVPTGNTAFAAERIVSQESQEYVIVYMRDGRKLPGYIVREDATVLVLRYLDPSVRIESTLTLQKRDILEIDRNVHAPNSQNADDDDTPVQDEEDPFAVDPAAPKEDRERGLMEGNAADTSLPQFYVIPMKGQMGTDIHPDAYRRIVEEINRAQPDVVIWHLRCSDLDDLLIPMNDGNESGLFLIDEYRELVRLLHDEIRGPRQVMWIEDAVGISAVIALAWPEMYMKPDARLIGMEILYRLTAGISDAEGLAKNREAILGMGNGFIERGRRPLSLGLALMDPRKLLSASWRGREVIWHLDTSGEYVISGSTRSTPHLRAKIAEDFGISAGTAETLDDLALLLGYREYRVLDGTANQLLTRYVDSWRRSFDRSKTLWGDYQQNLRWSQSDPLRYLGRARNNLREIVAMMNRFPAVEIRWRTDMGVSKFQLETQIEIMNEQLRSLRRGGGAGSGGGVGGGGRGMGGAR